MSRLTSTVTRWSLPLFVIALASLGIERCARHRFAWPADARAGHGARTKCRCFQ